MTTHYVTIAQANAMLPTLRQAFWTLFQLHLRMRRLHDDLAREGQAPEDDEFDIHVEGASRELLAQRAELRALIDTMHQEIDAIHELGCIVKDLESGTVGWYAQDEDLGDIFLSWKMGEPEVAFWHELNTGDVARRPLSELGVRQQERRP